MTGLRALILVVLVAGSGTAASAQLIAQGELTRIEADVRAVADAVLTVMPMDEPVRLEAKTWVTNAVAYRRDDAAWIGFNPLWVQGMLTRPEGDRWPLIAVVAHEIGHHVAGDTRGPVRRGHAAELFADARAGAVLRRMGARLPQAQELWRDFAVRGSETHPPRAARLDAVERGWTEPGAWLDRSDAFNE
ncbi:hypothetical protein [Jannaschia sp. LMIT008]|uniref:hypothetical protein n=1 Tax=Jannaschia maritima TaxID=3032585 RepID=UPI00281183D6|nr:hypothetical protein [Jannaschia sp. LMIT008]